MKCSKRVLNGLRGHSGSTGQQMVLKLMRLLQKDTPRGLYLLGRGADGWPPKTDEGHLT